MYEDELTTEQEKMIGYFGIHVADEVVRVERHRIPASLPYGYPSWDTWWASRSGRPRPDQTRSRGGYGQARQAGNKVQDLRLPSPARGNRDARHAGDDGDHCALP